MVEFAFALLVFCILVCGIIDFGHAFYMKQVVTNASREGARYGITYRTDTAGRRVAPSSLSPTIRNYLLNGYLSSSHLPSSANPNVTLAGAGLSTGTRGANLEVTVTAVKQWIVISRLMPWLFSTHQITLTATTVMQCE